MHNDKETWTILRGLLVVLTMLVLSLSTTGCDAGEPNDSLTSEAPESEASAASSERDNAPAAPDEVDEPSQEADASITSASDIESDTAAPADISGADDSVVEASSDIGPEERLEEVEEGESPSPEEDIVEAPAPPPPAVIRIAPWPGRGMQIYISRDTPELDIEVQDAGGSSYPATVATIEDTSGLTLIALEGTTDPWEHIARVQRARELVEGLPEGERIALWRNDEWLSEFTDRREHLLERLDNTLFSPAAPSPVALLASVLENVEGPYGAIHRDLVIIGDTPDDEPTVDSIVAARERVVRIGVCPNMDDGEAFVIKVGQATALLEAPEPMESMAWVPCSPAAAAVDAYPYGDTIALYLDEEELGNFQWHEQNNSKADWTTHVAIGPALPQSAVAHFRGNSSLGCQRKSITINLDGGEPRRLAPNSADDEFLLISMCLDDRYFQQFLANHLLQSKGLFQPRQRYVRLTINGENRGVYLLLENPTETIRRRHVGVETVLRRRNEAKGSVADVKWPTDPDEALSARVEYEAVAGLVWNTPAEDLEATLAQHLDLEMFLQWLAFHTYVRNGDYVDEVYFFGSMEKGQLFYRISGWDADDLLSDCHHNGQNAFVVADQAGQEAAQERGEDEGAQGAHGAKMRRTAKSDGSSPTNAPIARERLINEIDG